MRSFTQQDIGFIHLYANAASVNSVSKMRRQKMGNLLRSGKTDTSDPQNSRSTKKTVLFEKHSSARAHGNAGRKRKRSDAGANNSRIPKRAKTEGSASSDSNVINIGMTIDNAVRVFEGAWIRLKRRRESLTPLNECDPISLEDWDTIKLSGRPIFAHVTKNNGSASNGICHSGSVIYWFDAINLLRTLCSTSSLVNPITRASLNKVEVRRLVRVITTSPVMQSFKQSEENILSTIKNDLAMMNKLLHGWHQMRHDGDAYLTKHSTEFTSVAHRVMTHQAEVNWYEETLISSINFWLQVIVLDYAQYEPMHLKLYAKVDILRQYVPLIQETVSNQQSNTALAPAHRLSLQSIVDRAFGDYDAAIATDCTVCTRAQATMITSIRQFCLNLGRYDSRIRLNYDSDFARREGALTPNEVLTSEEMHIWLTAMQSELDENDAQATVHRIVAIAISSDDDSDESDFEVHNRYDVEYSESESSQTHARSVIRTRSRNRERRVNVQNITHNDRSDIPELIRRSLRLQHPFRWTPTQDFHESNEEEDDDVEIEEDDEYNDSIPEANSRTRETQLPIIRSTRSTRTNQTSIAQANQSHEITVTASLRPAGGSNLQQQQPRPTIRRNTRPVRRVIMEDDDNT